MSTDRIPFSVDHLHPEMMCPVMELARAMRASPIGRHFLCPFEGYRSPMRQHYLFAGGKVTKARPWQSAHQYGMAVDFAGLTIDDNNLVIPDSWTWDVDERLWIELKRRAAIFGLDVPIKWDRGHVILPRVTELFGIK